MASDGREEALGAEGSVEGGSLGACLATGSRLEEGRKARGRNEQDWMSFTDKRCTRSSSSRNPGIWAQAAR